MCCLSKMNVLNWIFFFFKYSEWEGIVCHWENLLSLFFKSSVMPISIEICWTWPHLCPHTCNSFSVCSRVHYFAMFLLSGISYSSAGTTQSSANVSRLLPHAVAADFFLFHPPLYIRLKNHTTLRHYQPLWVHSFITPIHFSYYISSISTIIVTLVYQHFPLQLFSAH